MCRLKLYLHRIRKRFFGEIFFSWEDGGSGTLPQYIFKPLQDLLGIQWCMQTDKQTDRQRSCYLNIRINHFLALEIEIIVSCYNHSTTIHTISEINSNNKLENNEITGAGSNIHEVRVLPDFPIQHLGMVAKN